MERINKIKMVLGLCCLLLCIACKDNRAIEFNLCGVDAYYSIVTKQYYKNGNFLRLGFVAKKDWSPSHSDTLLRFENTSHLSRLVVNYKDSPLCIDPQVSLWHVSNGKEPHVFFSLSIRGEDLRRRHIVSLKPSEIVKGLSIDECSFVTDTGEKVVFQFKMSNDVYDHVRRMRPSEDYILKYNRRNHVMYRYWISELVHVHRKTDIR
ncbi:hypothetical protein HMPREF6485_0994 [Segatella buccae ATCC 33574]|jgi:hypothetical protein|uniref:Uncharacterized protein n=1 Tax=Segatella buccae ATCC 33574 TaxID=873513 RepID=E6K5V8_9BACT|nr:hypothetical protein HMPREF6485_0994 [Segatella buccae ATCC 33574]